jgi:two-component system NtrC family sensor kinase
MKNGGTLTISTNKTNGFLEVSFKDTGVGIPKENMEKLFLPLFTTKAKGTGMGLSVCKKLVDMHGGTIKVESEIGKGTTVTVKLPITKENGGEKT